MLGARRQGTVTATRRLVAVGALVLALGAAPLASAVANPSPDAAADFVKGLFDKARSLAAPTHGRTPDQDQQLLAFVHSGVDLRAIARFSTGPFWRQASDAERNRFLALFETFVAQTLGRRLGELGDRKLEIIKTVAVTPGAADDPDMLVMSRFVGSDNRPLAVDWRVRMGGTGPRIVDLIVEGISMAVAQRDEFITVIRNSGGKFGALIAKLEDWTANTGDTLAQQSATGPNTVGDGTRR